MPDTVFNQIVNQAEKVLAMIQKKGDMKIIQANYPQLEIVNNEKDHIQIWNNESDPQVIHVERENIDRLIEALTDCKEQFAIDQKQKSFIKKREKEILLRLKKQDVVVTNTGKWWNEKGKLIEACTDDDFAIIKKLTG